MNKFISIYSATVIIGAMSLTSTLLAALPTASAADDNSSCKVARYGFALNSDLQELQANFNGKYNTK